MGVATLVKVRLNFQGKNIVKINRNELKNILNNLTQQLHCTTMSSIDKLVHIIKNYDRRRTTVLITKSSMRQKNIVINTHKKKTICD